MTTAIQSGAIRARAAAARAKRGASRVPLSERPGNPAHGLRQAYDRLMAYGDLDAMKIDALGVVNRYVNNGASADRIRDMRLAIIGCVNIERLQFYLTNFIVAADGDAVITPGFGRR